MLSIQILCLRSYRWWLVPFLTTYCVISWFLLILILFEGFIQLSVVFLLICPPFPQKNKRMSINLCIDWGNTNVKAAIFDNDTLTKQLVFSEEAALEKVSS